MPRSAFCSLSRVVSQIGPDLDLGLRTCWPRVGIASVDATWRAESARCGYQLKAAGDGGSALRGGGDHHFGVGFANHAAVNRNGYRLKADVEVVGTTVSTTTSTTTTRTTTTISSWALFQAAAGGGRGGAGFDRFLFSKEVARSRSRSRLSSPELPVSSSSSFNRRRAADTWRASSSSTSSEFSSSSSMHDSSDAESTPRVKQRRVHPTKQGEWKGNFVSRPVLDYVLEHTKEHQILSKLRKETSILPGANMQTTKDMARFLAMLVQLTNARRAIEVGVFTGYSALAVLLAMPDDGKLVACDLDPKAMSVAERYFEAAGVLDKVDIRIGKAAETLQMLLDHGEANRYDFAFIDADKKNYINYYELLLQLVRPGGLIVVDNVLWYGEVANSLADSEITTAIREFNSYVLNDNRVSMTMLTVSDGVVLLQKHHTEVA